MKKLVLSFTAILLAVSMYAQTPEEKAAQKAAEKAAKEAKKAAEKIANDKYNQGMKCYNEAMAKWTEFLTWKSTEKNVDKIEAKQAQVTDEMIALSEQGNTPIYEALTSGNLSEKKIFDGYRAQDFMLVQLIMKELSKAQETIPFDTLKLCKLIPQFCDACHYQLKYGNPKDETHKNILPQVRLKFVKQAHTYLAYCIQFQLQQKNLPAAAEVFDVYANFSTKYPEVANEPEIKDPNPSVGQMAYYIYMYAFEAKDFATMDKYYELAMSFDDPEAKIGVEQRQLQTYLLKGDTLAWEKACKDKIKQDPSSSDSEIMIQNLLSFYSKKGGKAIAAFADEILAVNPNSKMANYGKGYSFLESRDYASALPYYQKCIEIDPNYIDGNYQCGFCLYQIGLDNGRAIADKKYATQAAADKESETKVKSYLRKAAPYFEKVRELTPDNPDRWASELKVIYNNLGEKEKAKELPDLY